jgi:glycosyltransferase involved in cell wall biosynthesis
MVGALFKNQGELLDVVALLKGEFPDLKLALVGATDDEGLLAPLRDKALRLGIEQDVLFTGQVPAERMGDVFGDLDIALSTFRNEGFGLVHIESLAAGTPVVAYDAGGVTDILEGNRAGVLVVGGPAEFAAAVAPLLRDASRRLEMGRAGIELVRNRFTSEAMTRSYLGLFDRLMGR